MTDVELFELQELNACEGMTVRIHDDIEDLGPSVSFSFNGIEGTVTDIQPQEVQAVIRSLKLMCATGLAA